MTERDEAALVLLAQAGDRAALGDLLEGVQPRLRGYLRLITRDGARADDALQDAFVIAVRKLRFLRDPRAFRAWIYRIATREARRGWREPAADTDEAALEADVDIERDAMTAETAAVVRDRVAELPEKARAVIALHYFEEMPLEAIAAILDAPLGTVKSRLAYGLAKLREKGFET
jgi:RNA polymerase sigma-70 factor (ECF subfamily)